MHIILREACAQVLLHCCTVAEHFFGEGGPRCSVREVDVVRSKHMGCWRGAEVGTGASASSKSQLYGLS